MDVSGVQTEPVPSGGGGLTREQLYGMTVEQLQALVDQIRAEAERPITEEESRTIPPLDADPNFSMERMLGTQPEQAVVPEPPAPTYQGRLLKSALKWAKGGTEIDPEEQRLIDLAKKRQGLQGTISQ